MGVVSCYRLPGIRSFVLEVRSWSGNNVPENLYQMNVILCLDQKGQSPKAQLLPSKVPVLAKRRKISLGSSFKAKFPYPTQLSSLREPGIQPNWPSVSSGHPNGETRSHKLWLIQMVTGSGSQRQGWEEVHCFSKSGPQLVEGLSEGSGALQDVVPGLPSLLPGPSSSPAGPRLGKLEGLQEKACICLLPHFPPDDHHPMDCWPNHFPSGPLLTFTSGQDPLQR